MSGGEGKPITNPASYLSRRRFTRTLLAGAATVGGLAVAAPAWTGEFTRHRNQSSDIPYGDIDALIAQGWIPAYRDTGKSYHAVEVDALDRNFSGSAGERNEIGLVPEEYAAYIATRDPRYRDHTLRLADLVPREDWRDKEVMTKAIWRGGKWSIDYAHTPAYWYSALLETGDPWYAFPAEQIYRWHHLWLHGQSEDAPEAFYATPMEHSYNGRGYAWMMRNLARLARLQTLGLTRYSYYQDAMQANLDYMLANRVKNPDSLNQEWRVIGWNKGLLKQNGHHSFTGWMESMIGQALGHIVQLGFKDWMPVAEWHLEQLARKIEYWGMKGIDHDHYYVEERVPYTYAGRNPYPETEMTEAFLKAPKDKLVDTNMRRADGGRYTYANRAQYAYGWAAIQSQAGVPGARELAEQIDAAITARGDVRDYKNTPAIQ